MVGVLGSIPYPKSVEAPGNSPDLIPSGISVMPRGVTVAPACLAAARASRGGSLAAFTGAKNGHVFETAQQARQPINL